MAETNFRSKLKRGVAVPTLAGAAVFLLCVAFAIFIATYKSVAGDTFAAEADISFSDETGELHLTEQEGFGDNQADEKLLVHVAGSVESPGIVELAAGSRVADALEKAGGPLPEAVLEGVNLARVLVDGEQIVVPNENTPSQEAQSQGSSSGLVSLNSSSQTELETLPGVGPALSLRIINWREENGGFKTLEDLMSVSGIGHKVFENIEPLVSL